LTVPLVFVALKAMNSLISALHRLVLFALLTVGALSTRASVKLNGLFTDNMVLQRDAKVPIWGWADEGEKVVVEFRGQKVSTFAKGGKWMVHLDRLRAGGPSDFTVTGKNPTTSANNNSITLKDVLVGEVWIASGQSNMEWPLRAAFEPQKEMSNSANPMIRLYTVPKLKANEAKDNVNAAWLPCNPETVPDFSAVAYYFAKNLQMSLGVPIGIIHTSWGGSPVEVWMSESVLAGDPEWKRDILDAGAAQLKKAEEAIAQFTREEAEAKRDGKPFDQRKPGLPWKATELYNGMIAPLVPFAIKGAIWYQGESNAGRAQQYRSLFPAMIKNWRNVWGEGEFTFLEVQLAPFMAIKPEPGESTWAELREAQLLATKILPNVGMAVITDVGDQKDIHPKQKEVVGNRLARVARHIAYGQKLVWSGPTFKTMKVRETEAVLSFDNLGGGLVGRKPVARIGKEGETPDRPALIYETESGRLNWPLTGFAICGEDRKWVWADARIEDDKVIVSSRSIAKPVAVRYGWADFPVVNLCNAEGLPASPFRTDEFPMITAPKTAVVQK
jgi:sialate O-acetylesterase